MTIEQPNLLVIVLEEIAIHLHQILPVKCLKVKAHFETYAPAISLWVVKLHSTLYLLLDLGVLEVVINVELLNIILNLLRVATISFPEIEFELIEGDQLFEVVDLVSPESNVIVLTKALACFDARLNRFNVVPNGICVPVRQLLVKLDFVKDLSHLVITTLAFRAVARFVPDDTNWHISLIHEALLSR